MASIVELENHAPQCGRIRGADADAIAWRPASVFVLCGLQVVEHRRAVLVPGFAAFAKRVLSVVVVGQIVPAELYVATHGQVGLTQRGPLRPRFVALAVPN